jgi:hypothetical protein
MFAEYFKLTKNEIFTSKPELRKFRRSRNPPESDKHCAKNQERLQRWF